MMNRRQFLQAAGAAGFMFHFVPRHCVAQSGQTPPSGKLNIAGIGVGGRGGGVISEMGGENIVALCDTDWTKAAGTFKKFDKAVKYKDYRILLEKEKDLDAVMVGTPDHMHAPITLAALRSGKHVYVEKPMAHTIEEARIMTKVAKETGLVTQMGNNGHAGEGLRQTREWIKAGAIGTVKEIHVWSDRPAGWWPQGVRRPAGQDPIPGDFDWDLWLGAAPMRPYVSRWADGPHKGKSVYHPFSWRGWFDFGTGALGDMAVHNMDPAFYALDLEAPVAAEAQTSGLTDETYPEWQIITYEFAAKGDRPAVKMVWYDGKKMPPTPKDVEGQFNLPDNGIIFIGDKGTMVGGGWSGQPRLFPAQRRKEFQLPAKSIPRSPGHVAEFLKATKDRKPQDAMAGFWYSGMFTEALLVGNLAVRLNKRVEWDSANMKATNAPEAERLIKKTYRKGYGLS